MIINSSKIISSVGILISIILLIILLNDVDWDIIKTTLKTSNLQLIPICALLTFINIGIRSLRWLTISAKSFEEFGVFLSATWIGYFFNTLYPARIGEIIRIFLVCNNLHLSHRYMLTKSIIDRMFDLILVVIFAGIGLIYFDYNFFTYNLSLHIFLSLIVMIVVFSLLFYYSKVIEKLILSLIPKLGSLLSNIFYALEESQNIMLLSKSFVLTILVFVVDLTLVWFFFKALQFELPYDAILVVCIAIYLGMLIPSAPAQLGVHQAACVLALALYNVDNNRAIAYSIVMQVTSIGVIILVALWIFMFGSLKVEWPKLSAIREWRDK